jgi:hypothetical protein
MVEKTNGRNLISTDNPMLGLYKKSLEEIRYEQR